MLSSAALYMSWNRVFFECIIDCLELLYLYYIIKVIEFNASIEVPSRVPRNDYVWMIVKILIYYAVWLFYCSVISALIHSPFVSRLFNFNLDADAKGMFFVSSYVMIGVSTLFIWSAMAERLSFACLRKRDQ